MLTLSLNGSTAPTNFTVGAVNVLFVLADGLPVLQSTWEISSSGFIIAQGQGPVVINFGQPGGYFVNVVATDQTGNQQEALFAVTATLSGSAASAIGILWSQPSYTVGSQILATLAFRSQLGARAVSLAWSLYRNEVLVLTGASHSIVYGNAQFGIYRIRATAVDENGNPASADSSVAITGGFELLSAIAPPQPAPTLRYLGSLYSVITSGGPVQCTTLPFTLSSVTQEFLLIPGTTHFSFDIDPTLNLVDDEVIVRTNLGNWALIGPPTGLHGEPFAYDYQINQTYLPAPVDLKVWATVEGVNAHGGVVSAFNFRVRLKCYRTGLPVYQYTACPYSNFTGGPGARERRLVALFTKLDIDLDVNGPARLGVASGPQTYTLPNQQRLLCNASTGGVADSAQSVSATINARFQNLTLQIYNTDTGNWNTIYAAGADPYPTYALYPSSTPGPKTDDPIAPVGVNYRFQGSTLQLYNQDTGGYNTVGTAYSGLVIVLNLLPSSTPPGGQDSVVALIGLNYALVEGYLLFQNLTDNSYDFITTVFADPYPDIAVQQYAGLVSPPVPTEILTVPGLVTESGVSATIEDIISTYEPVNAALAEIDVQATYGIAGVRPACLNFTQLGQPRSLQKIRHAYGRLAVFVAAGAFNAGDVIQVSLYSGQLPGALQFYVTVQSDVYSPDTGIYVWVGDVGADISDFEFGHTGLIEDFAVSEPSFLLSTSNYRFCASTFQLYNQSTKQWNSIYTYGADPWAQIVVMPSSNPGALDAEINPSGVNYRFYGKTFQLLNQTTGNYNTVNTVGTGSYPEVEVFPASSPGAGLDSAVAATGLNYAFIKGFFTWLNLTTAQNNVPFSSGSDPYPTLEVDLASNQGIATSLPVAGIAPSVVNVESVSAPTISVDGACYSNPTLIQPLLDGPVYQSYGTTAGCGDVACGPVGLYCYTAVSGTGSVQAAQPLYYPSPVVSLPYNQGVCFANPVLISEITANGTQSPVNGYTNVTACGTGYLYNACSGTVTPLAVIYPAATSAHTVVSYGTLCWSLSGSISDLRPYTIVTANLTTPVASCLDVLCTGSNVIGPSVMYLDVETLAQVNVQFPSNGGAYNAHWGATPQKADSGVGSIPSTSLSFIASATLPSFLATFQEVATINVVTSHKRQYKRLTIKRGSASVYFDLFQGMDQIQIQVQAGDALYADFTQLAQRAPTSGVATVSWQRIVVLPRVYDTVTVPGSGASNVVQAVGFCGLNNRSPYTLYSLLPADSRQTYPNPDTFLTVSGTAASESVLVRSRAVGDASGENLPFPWYAGQAIAGPLTFNFYASRINQGSHGEMDVWLSNESSANWPGIFTASPYKALKLNPSGWRRSAAPGDTSRGALQVASSLNYGSPRIYASPGGRTISVNTSGSAVPSVTYAGQIYSAAGTIDYGVSAFIAPAAH